MKLARHCFSLQMPTACVLRTEGTRISTEQKLLDGEKTGNGKYWEQEDILILFYFIALAYSLQCCFKWQISISTSTDSRP